MASTYTGLGTQLMKTGEKAGTWGTLTNTNWNISEQIAGGYTTQALSTTGATALAVADATAGGHSHSKITSMQFKPFLGYQIQKNAHNYSTLKVAISEGKNRELRRFFAHFGAEIADLKRVSFAEIELNNLPEGKTRFLTRSEYSALFTFLKSEEKLAREMAGSKPKPAFKAKFNKAKPAPKQFKKR